MSETALRPLLPSARNTLHTSRTLPFLSRRAQLARSIWATSAKDGGSNRHCSNWHSAYGRAACPHRLSSQRSRRDGRVVGALFRSCSFSCSFLQGERASAVASTLPLPSQPPWCSTSQPSGFLFWVTTHQAHSSSSWPPRLVQLFVADRAGCALAGTKICHKSSCNQKQSIHEAACVLLFCCVHMDIPGAFLPSASPRGSV